MRPIADSVCMCVQLPQRCSTLCDPVDYSPPGSSVQAILQARILEWVAFPPLGDLPNPRTEPTFVLQVDSLLLSHQGSR